MISKIDTLAVVIIIILLIILLDTSEKAFFDLEKGKINDIYTQPFQKTKKTKSITKNTKSTHNKSKHLKNMFNKTHNMTLNKQLAMAKKKIKKRNKKNKIKFKSLKLDNIKKGSTKVRLKTVKYKDNDDKNILAVKNWLMDNTQGLDKEAIEKESALITMVDINNDNIEDIIAIPASSYCSEEPIGCEITTFLSPNFKDTISLKTKVLPSFAIYVTPDSNDNLHNIIINENFLCTYNKKEGYTCK